MSEVYARNPIRSAEESIAALKSEPGLRLVQHEPDVEESFRKDARETLADSPRREREVEDTKSPRKTTRRRKKT